MPNFTEGSSVTISMKVSKPGTTTPANPATHEITLLSRDGVDVLDELLDPSMEKVTDGLFQIVLADLEPGFYRYAVTASDGPLATVVQQDEFVVDALTV